MASKEWSDRIAVVTGAGGGMGIALARELLGRGATVAGFDLRPEIELNGEDRARYLPVVVDLGDRQSIMRGFEAVDRKLGMPTDLVNLAATWSTTFSLLELEEVEWDKVMGVNVSGTLWCCQEALRRMLPRRRGAIVNISSLNGLMARMGIPTHAYSISKAAVVGLTRTLAAEAAAYGIRINCVAPGLHTTPGVAEGLGEEGAKQYIATAIKTTPVGRVAGPEEMIGPILFLLSEDSANIVGQTLVSDGGRGIWYQ